MKLFTRSYWEHSIRSGWGKKPASGLPWYTPWHTRWWTISGHRSLLPKTDRIRWFLTGMHYGRETDKV